MVFVIKVVRPLTNIKVEQTQYKTLIFVELTMLWRTMKGANSVYR